MERSIRNRLRSHRWYRAAREILEPPQYEGGRDSLTKRLNLYLARLERVCGRTRLWSRPFKLTIEAASACNLSCPACFTGLGETSGRGALMPLDLYRKLLDELGDWLYEVELHNWGEPLLNKNVATMIEETTARGVSTTLSTNFSIPFDAIRAERLVAAGLSVLGVSIDGARQESYAQYRVNGTLETVLRNCRLVSDAKRRLGSRTPRLVWEFHVFEHNEADVDLAGRMAADLGMDLVVSKGWIEGEEWNPDGPWKFFPPVVVQRCPFLWQQAVVQIDGGVAPCCGSFYREDDVGRVAVGAGDGGALTFRAVWNGGAFRAARGLFRSRTGPEALQKTICFDCPATVTWARWQEHRRRGEPAESFVPGYTHNDAWNYFWSRRPTRERAPRAERARRSSR